MTGWMFSLGYSDACIGPVEYEKMGKLETRLTGDSRRWADFRRRVPSAEIYPNEVVCREAAGRAVRSKIAGLLASVSRWEKVLQDLNLDAPSEGVGRG